MTFLASDNTAGISPEIIKALELANSGYAKAYGADEYTERLTTRFREVFESNDLIVFPVFNGSAANSLALTSLIKPFESVIAHTHSHIERDECGLTEFFTGGKILGVSGEQGRINLQEAESIIQLAQHGGIHHSRPKAISITQPTEEGAIYKIEEIKSLSALAKSYSLYLHMDGARVANAIASLDCKPSEMTWKAGVDVLSFGGTKNGAMLAEAVIFFNPDLAKDFGYMRKRAGQLASKQRFISAQLLALLEHDLWIKNAQHANLMAQKLAQGLRKASEIKILFPVEANSIFVEIPRDMADSLLAKGHYFYSWPLLGRNIYRLVTSFNTLPEDIDRFIDSCT